MLDLLPAGPAGSPAARRCARPEARGPEPRITKVPASSAVGAAYPLPDALDTFWSVPADKAALRNAWDASSTRSGRRHRRHDR